MKIDDIRVYKLKSNVGDIKMIPMVSVIIPLYNKEPHIKRTINSILAQKIQDFEIIIVDDGSTDKSAEVVKEFTDPRIRLIQQENAGVSAARNRGIEEAKADLVAFLDADDEWTPSFLETVFRLREKYPEAGIYVTAYLFCNPKGEVRTAKYKEIEAAPWEGLIKSYFLSAAKGEHPVCSSAVCIPRKVLMKEKGFKVGISWGEDDDMWGRIALNHPVAFSWQTGAIYHKGATNRLCNLNKMVEHPFIETAEKAIINGTVKSEMTKDLKECIARYKIVSAVNNLFRGYPTASRDILKSCHTRRLYKQKIFWYILSIIPYKLFTTAIMIMKELKNKVNLRNVRKVYFGD